MHPDPDGAVRGRGGLRQTPRQRRVGPARPDACSRRRQRGHRAEAAEAVIAVESLRTRDLHAAAGEQVGAQRLLAVPDRADRDHRLDEVAPCVVARLGAVGRVGVEGLRRRQIALLHGLQAAVATLGKSWNEQREQIADFSMPTLYRWA